MALTSFELWPAPAHVREELDRAIEAESINVSRGILTRLARPTYDYRECNSAT
jgi:hypothetical protein